MVTALIVIVGVGGFIALYIWMILRVTRPRDRITQDVRKVRLHLQSGVMMDRQGRIETVAGTTIEGLLAGTRVIGSLEHYVLYEPRVLEKDADSDRVVGTTPSGHLEIPLGRVEAVEILGA
jgi:hypothetical protein